MDVDISGYIHVDIYMDTSLYYLYDAFTLMIPLGHTHLHTHTQTNKHKHTGLQSQHTKLQIASLNVACCVLAQLPPTPPTPPSPTTSNTTTAPPHAPPHDDPFVLASLQESLYAEGAFGGALWPLLSHESPAVRGKAAVAVVLMGRRHVTWWVDTCSSKVWFVVWVGVCMYTFFSTCVASPC